MPISVPFGVVWQGCKWLWDQATKCLFLPTYRHSHGVWRKRHCLGAYWSDCTNYMEYSLYLPHAADPEPRIPIIALRAKDGVIHSASFVFQAESDAVCFQEPISVRNLTQKPVLWKLQNIPYQELLHADDRGIRFSWDEYRIINLRLSFKDGSAIEQDTSLRSNLTHTWLLNSEWDKRWGIMWNLDVVKFAKSELAIYWRFGFWRSGTYLYATESFVQRTLVSTIRQPIEWLMTRNISLSIQFWLALWSGMWCLDDDWRLAWRWRRTVGRDEDEISDETKRK